MRWRLQQEDSGWLSLLVSLLLGCSIDEMKGCEAVDCVLSTPPGFPTECIKCYTRCPVNDMYWTQDQPPRPWRGSNYRVHHRLDVTKVSSGAVHHVPIFSKNDKKVLCEKCR